MQRAFENFDGSRRRQIDAEEHNDTRKRKSWINTMVKRLNKFLNYHPDVVRRGMRTVTKSAMKHHEERDGERERIQRQREDDEHG